jgi:Galactoside-binding lectin
VLQAKFPFKMSNFLSVLSDSPATGHVFTVSGKTSYNAQKFNVSLMCGKTGNSDIAMMIFCNFGDGKVGRSSLVNGNWNETEDYAKVSNPIKRGEDFNFHILVGDDRFHVSINDESFCTYNFKTAVKEIKAISVSGDVESISQVDHKLVFPSIYPLVNNDTPDVTFSGMIPRKFQPGHVTIMSGVASGNPQGEFVIFFLENDSSRQLIHFNSRFDQQDVVINTMNGDDEYEM